MNGAETRIPSSIVWFARVGLMFGGAMLGTLIPVALITALPGLGRSLVPHGDSAFYAQEVMALPALTIIVGAPLSGFLAERFGLRTCLLPMLILYTLAGSWGLVAPDIISLLISRLLLGLAGGGIITLTLYSAALFFEAEERDRMIGFTYATSGVAAIATILLGGWVVDKIGWRAPFSFYLLGLPVFMCAVVALRDLKVAVPATRSIDREAGAHGSLFALWPIYSLLLVLSFGIWMLGIEGPFLLEAAGITSARIQSVEFSISSSCSALAAAGFGFMRSRLNDRNLLILAAASLGSGTALLGLVNGPYALAAGFVLYGAAAGICAPAFSSVILSVAPAGLRARATGFMTSLIFLGQFLTPLIVTPLHRGLGINNAFIIVGAVLFATAALVPFANRTRPRVSLA